MNEKIQKRTILTYADVARVPAAENGEPLVDVKTYNDSIVVQYQKLDMTFYTQERVFVRDTVAKKLAAVQEKFTKKNQSLKVVYGYRHPNVQMEYFEKQRLVLSEANQELSSQELDELVHGFVAVPDVAGHPTGGAVDLTFVNPEGSEVDMGTRIADYADPRKIKTFAEGLSDLQVLNRRALHEAMVEQGFAPFYGEWWHFSYGDREWACLYGLPTSLYSPVEFKT